MNLYDVIPENLFSLLVSKNKSLYVKSLFVLLRIFKQHLKIRREELVSTISESLEEDILYADFSEEALLENEESYSGKAHFLVRKLRDTGWIMIETDWDFQEYITLPGYSIKIINLLVELTNVAPRENFAYVYSTYSSLKNADSTRDVFEMVTALYDGVQRTEQLVESLKAVYHSIGYYYQQQIDMIEVNKVLDSHFTMYREEIVEKILRPLKIRDSVPKYKMPLTLILRKWLTENQTVEEMAEYLLKTSRFPDLESCRDDLKASMFYIIDTYEGLEKDYIKVIDARNQQYTRSTTQKIDYLLNSDQTVRGNLITLLKGIDGNDRILEEISDSFELFHQFYMSEDSLYDRKNSTKRNASQLLELEEDDDNLAERAKSAAARLLKNRYNKQRVMDFMKGLLAEKSVVSTSEISIEDDDVYIMTLMAVVYASDRDSFYTVEFAEGHVTNGLYDVPHVVYKRK